MATKAVRLFLSRALVLEHGMLLPQPYALVSILTINTCKDIPCSKFLHWLVYNKNNTCTGILTVVFYISITRRVRIFPKATSKTGLYIAINYIYGLGHWLDMVYLPPRGNFVDHIFLKA